MAKGKDTRDHANRRVDKGSYLDRAAAQQQAMWRGIDAAEIASHVSELDEEANERITHSQDTDIAPAHGIPRPSRDFLSGPSSTSDSDEELEKGSPEDTQEAFNLKQERLKRGYF